MLKVLMFLVPIALAIYALVDCISTKDDEIKHLPKLVWLLLIVFAWIIGPLAWVIAGRKRSLPKAPGSRPAGGGGWVAPDDNPDFLRSINHEQQREENERDKELLESWEEDLRRRESELRDGDDNDGKGGSGPAEGNPPAKG
ncbi:PLD nuclease N-terminal domain-containing protein [Streptomyces bohaiensis]|uniref:PLDc_N domain-containing protein n=1 Tax=Streptomyces bohaiensis TaxID=1431344 RepID=A0ABX1CLK0_9ACTN|nr:PLD nuclease N-terminal domain-containing protein [Streptomyces bohaiensis]NJQ17509.1 PLDc_N domain-containing protein [Streptomyces bohaiensis]